MSVGLGAALAATTALVRVASVASSRRILVAFHRRVPDAWRRPEINEQDLRQEGWPPLWFLVPVVVGAVVLEAAEFPAGITLGSLATYGVYNAHLGLSADRARQAELQESLDLPPLPSSRSLGLAYAAARASVSSCFPGSWVLHWGPGRFEVG